MGIRQRLAHWLDPPEQRSMSSWDLLKAGMAGWGIADASGQIVTHKSAEHAVSTISACVQGIASALASQPAYVYVWQGDRRVEAPAHPLQRLISRGPNQHQSWSDWLEQMVSGALLRGNSVSEIIVDNAGRLTELRPLSWDMVSIVQLPGDRVAYDISNERTGGTRRLLQSEIYHLKDRCDGDSRVGVSPLERCAGVVGQAQAINHFASAMWKNGVSPSGSIQVEGKLGSEAFAQLQARWRELYAGPDAAGRALVLDQGAKWQQIGIAPDNAELLLSRRFTCEEIARLFGTPPIMVGIWDNASFTNSEMASRWYASHTLAPWARKIELEAKRSLFSREAAVNHELVIDLSDMLRGSPLERAQAAKLAVEGGWLDTDEIRQQENWPPRGAAPEPVP
jgi:HK97 family phage portal protein